MRGETPCPTDLEFLARAVLPCRTRDGYRNWMISTLGDRLAAHRSACLTALSVGSDPENTVAATFSALVDATRRAYGFPEEEIRRGRRKATARTAGSLFNGAYDYGCRDLRELQYRTLRVIPETVEDLAERMMAAIPAKVQRAFFDGDGRTRALTSLREGLLIDPERLRVEQDLAEGRDVPLETLAQYPDLLAQHGF